MSAISWKYWDAPKRRLRTWRSAIVANAFTTSSSLLPCRTRMGCPTAWAAASTWRIAPASLAASDRRERRSDRAAGGPRGAIPGASDLPRSRRLHSRHVAARPVEACDEAGCTGSTPTRRRSGWLRSPSLQPPPRRPARPATPPEGQPARPRAPATIDSSLGASVFDRDIPADDKARLLQSLEKRGPARCSGLRGAAAEISDDRHARLRRGPERRKRGAHRRSARRLAPAHSITSSARARIDCGTVRPSALAVLRLMTSSNLVGCWTGRSAGLAPLRIFPA